jgi:BolA family transcriptional regulator, general stress-responsive regulator
MITIYDKIKKKIKQKINPKNIILIDNSKHHQKHKFFDANKLHLKIIIESDNLKKISKIEAHKKVFSILKEEMKSKIHALEIEIK